MPVERNLLPRSSSRRSWLAGSLFASVLLLISPERSTAIDSASIEIGDVQGSGWSASKVSATLELGANAQVLVRLRIERANLMPEIGPLADITVTCRNPLVKEPVFGCRGATVSGRFGKVGRQTLSADLEYQNVRGTLTFAIKGVKVAGGSARIDGQWLENGWTFSVDAKGTRLADVLAIVSPWVSLPEGITADGKATFKATLRGGDALQEIGLRGKLSALAANNVEGTLATDKLDLDVDLTMKPAGDDWDLRTTLASASGQFYFDPIFMDFSPQPITVTLAGRLRANGLLDVARLDFNQRGVGLAMATGQLDLEGETLLKQFAIDVQRLEFPGAFGTLMQPFLAGTEYRDLTTSGVVTGRVEVDASAPALLDLTFADVTAEDKVGRLGIRNLRGHLAWRSTARHKADPNAGDLLLNAKPSHLEWQSSTAYGIAGGAARVDFATAGASFRVLEPTFFPILDGGLAVGHLSVRDFGAPGMSLRFDADLKPISMPLLCKAFGWPEFAGKLEGSIPQVRLEQKVLSLGGDLKAQVFDGTVVVNALQLQDPLGDYPRLNANLTMRNLDLEAVTGAFSFGTITGRLNVDVKDLELFQWAPIQFDLRLYTPDKDKSKHLISQRAVKNLSNIGGAGGGVAAALQSGLLRFFENFRYSRLGLSCRLSNDICEMDGIEKQQGDAYYIVKGSGLPRIDIIGNAHRVSWNRLVSQLAAITESGGPVVQ